ncbi:uncharacterized protein [Physcomitrium patens]|uniref:Uncharacterized protein n=1 Tax=Physcomitrium patens TaxID=3218 RepID=A0A2K1IH19_PHYPA|nr:uncharacterized protein LOC112276360 [Physcomitrium patens]PNR28576.1 hypothetical protein PHYPA_029168 [Physcomitrium patens]|eukprot:XP_024363373.1 uncharacterized protein LOC112276360 [Physcomitrella patens]
MPSLGLCRPPFVAAANAPSHCIPSCSSASTSVSRFLAGGPRPCGSVRRRWVEMSGRTSWSRPRGHVECRAQGGEGVVQNFDDSRRQNESWRAYAFGDDLPTQAEAVTQGTQTVQTEYKATPDLDYLQELLAIQQNGPRAIGFFGTRNMGFMHQQLIEILSYAMVITKNHIYTSGAAGTNAAVIRGALRAERPDLLTVILPQSLKRQPAESQDLLSKVKNVVEMPHNDHLPLIEASRLCNMDIISHVQQVICFAFHDSNLLMETCSEAKNMRKIVTLFYLD